MGRQVNKVAQSLASYAHHIEERTHEMEVWCIGISRKTSSKKIKIKTW